MGKKSVKNDIKTAEQGSKRVKKFRRKKNRKEQHVHMPEEGQHEPFRACHCSKPKA
jgi:hypothetical protein